MEKARSNTRSRDEIFSDLVPYFEGYIIAAIRVDNPDAITWYVDYDQYLDDWFDLYIASDPELYRQQREALPICGRLYVDSAEERDQALQGFLYKIRNIIKIGRVSMLDAEAAMAQARQDLNSEPYEGLAISLAEFQQLVEDMPIPRIGAKA